VAVATRRNCKFGDSADPRLPFSDAIVLNPPFRLIPEADMWIWPRLRTSFGEPEDYDQCGIDRASCEELRNVSTFY
jgi:hypothetical protein